MKPSKIFQVILVLILMSSTTLMAYPAHAESAPSVPRFTLQYVDRSYSIPPTYGTDPYTGNTTETSPGRYVDNRTLEVVIQNQPFTPYQNVNGTTIQLYYNIRSKGHYTEFTSDTDYGSHSITGVAAATSSVTVVSFSIDDWNIPSGGKIDFEVQAFIGYTYYNGGGCFTADVVTVGESAWSSPQTVTFDNGAVSIGSTWTPSPTATPEWYNSTATPTPREVPTATPIQLGSQGSRTAGFDWQQPTLIIMAAVIAVLFGVLVSVIRWRKAVAQ